VPSSIFLDKNFAKQLLENINVDKTSSATDIDPTNFKIKENTTHYSVVDKNGNAVSTTTTLNTAYGSGIVIKDTGILMNNEMDDFSAAPNQPNYFELLGNEANKIEPMKRPLSSMTPTIVFQDGKPIIITGAQGGSRIITAVLQIILNYHEFNLGAEESVHLHRYHHQWKPEVLMYEMFSEDLINELENLGFELRQRPPNYDYSNGITSSIMIEDNKLIGVSDPRSGDYMSIGISKKK
jgi:gamma-glutamyltranspeptidase/glutathione hydrolase